ncbi:cysteine desulfurase family protein [Erwinia sp. AnSW2-5]|uniref:cysteine desulfurase family protein n=1 Tax=Erwinia sp. AnSW2-5 TaxID=3367692 RepID=UPI003858E95D
MKVPPLIPVYLDYNATTPCDDKVIEEMIPFFNVIYGNAASTNNHHGNQAHHAVEEARKKISTLIGSNPDEIIFTSGATESNNLALRGLYSINNVNGNHIITSSIEHPSILATLKDLEKEGASVTYIEPETNGEISVDKIKSAIMDTTILISIMYANNELGTINAIDSIGNIAREYGITFMCDATQAVGKMTLDMHSNNIDLLTFSAHKIYGPKGVGALYLRKSSGVFDTLIKKQITGGYGESGLRSGTLNVPGIVGFGKAAERAEEALNTGEPTKMKRLRDRFEQQLLTFAMVTFNGAECPRLPHVSSVTFADIDFKRFLEKLTQSLSISTSSACSSGHAAGSHVLRGIGLNDHQVKSSVRFSFGRQTRPEEVEFALTVIKELYPTCHL